jgi:hypothetical protein
MRRLHGLHGLYQLYQLQQLHGVYRLLRVHCVFGLHQLHRLHGVKRDVVLRHRDLQSLHELGERAMDNSRQPASCGAGASSTMEP